MLFHVANSLIAVNHNKARLAVDTRGRYMHSINHRCDSVYIREGSGQ